MNESMKVEDGVLKVADERADILEDIETCGNRLAWIRNMILEGHETLESEMTFGELCYIQADLGNLITRVLEYKEKYSHAGNK